MTHKKGRPTNMRPKEESAWEVSITPQTFLPAEEQPSPEAMKKLAEYIKMLGQWNRALNLVGCRDAATLMADLVPDSFYLARFLDALPLPENPLIWEPGAGGGIPGIPLRIVRPRGHYTLIEVREKRAIFLANVLARLQLPNTAVIRGPAQDFFQREKQAGRLADCVLSRAFMPWQELLPFCRPSLAVSGILVLLANSPPPELPAGWELADCAQYAAAGKKRWLWALRPTLAQDAFGQ